MAIKSSSEGDKRETLLGTKKRTVFSFHYRLPFNIERVGRFITVMAAVKLSALNAF